MHLRQCNLSKNTESQAWVLEAFYPQDTLRGNMKVTNETIPWKMESRFKRSQW